MSRLKLKFAKLLSLLDPARVALTLCSLSARRKASREKHNFFIPLATLSYLCPVRAFAGFKGAVALINVLIIGVEKEGER